MHYFLIILLTSLISCSSEDFTSVHKFKKSEKSGTLEKDSSSGEKDVSSGSESDDSRVVLAEAEAEASAGNGGFTVGNGNNDNDSIDEEVNEPVVIIGSYLTCKLSDSSTVSCISNEPLSEAAIEDIILLDQDGQEVPKSQLSLEIIEATKRFEMIIKVADDYKIEGIQDASEPEQADGSTKDPDSAPAVEDSKVPVFISYNPDTRDHMQGLVEGEGAPNYFSKGISFYIFSRPVEKSVQIVRCYNGLNKNHYLRTGEKGCDFAHSKEGSIGYLYSDESKGQAVYSCHKNALFAVDSFASTDPDECLNEDYKVVEILGYAP